MHRDELKRMTWLVLSRLNCAAMRWTSQKWYNMQYINMSGKLPMGIAGNSPRVRYSAAYPTGRERSAKGLLYHGV